MRIIHELVGKVVAYSTSGNFLLRIHFKLISAKPTFQNIADYITALTAIKINCQNIYTIQPQTSIENNSYFYVL